MDRQTELNQLISMHPFLDRCSICMQEKSAVQVGWLDGPCDSHQSFCTSESVFS